jgi:hypothetical protein
MNKHFNIEINIKSYPRAIISNMRQLRNQTCHYLFENDAQYITFKKIEYAIIQLSIIDTDIKEKIENSLGVYGIIDAILEFVKENLDTSVTIVNNTCFTDKQINNIIMDFWDE